MIAAAQAGDATLLRELIIPPPDRHWSNEDWVLIRRGHKSSDMDDKWHAFVEGQRLYLHRSWQAAGSMKLSSPSWQIRSAVVEGNCDSYRRHDDLYESAMLETLIDGKLLGVYAGPCNQRLARARAERGMA
jgi:hypothetical protein